MLPCFPKDKSTEEAYMLRQCSWQGKTVNCSDIFTPVVTDSGICCAFNVKNTLKETEFSGLLAEMQGQNETMELLTAAPGIQNGLQVIIDQNSNR